MQMQAQTLYANRKGFCAFCKHWYDPTNSHIAPKRPQNNLWEFDRTAKCKCMIYGVEKNAYSSCLKYECKVELTKK